VKGARAGRIEVRGTSAEVATESTGALGKEEKEGKVTGKDTSGTT